MQKFNVTIEQPMIVSFTIEAKDEEEAHTKGRELFEAMENSKFRDHADFGTDAQIQIESEDGKLSTEWTDL